MEINTIIMFAAAIIIPALLVALIVSSIVTVQQGIITVITTFGKYKRIMSPGLNFKIPVVEQVCKRISTQNLSAELKFQAITIDQANVYFKAMLLYSTLDQTEETIKKVAFKFIDDNNFLMALTRTVEGCIRGYVSSKKQTEVLSLRKDITTHVKEQIDTTLSEWGYHLQDLQLNDMTFDTVIMESMSKVVASNNLKAAAENEGQALLITKTKGAEAEGNAIKISAKAEKEAAELRGQGVAAFRREVAKGMAESAKELENAHLDISMITFSMWTEAIKHFAENGKGNVIFLDGSAEGMQKTMKQVMGMNQMFNDGEKQLLKS